jgi:hypothetical protein
MGDSDGYGSPSVVPVGVHIPAQYKEGAEAPCMVVHDGPGQANGYKAILDYLIHQTTSASW